MWTFAALAKALTVFLVSATCVGVRPGEVYAPNGLALVYEGVLSMNPLLPYRGLFDRKVRSYLARWPSLRVRPDVVHLESEPLVSGR
jgi:uncharacterized protein